jgi:hypothetical protein
MRKRTTLQKKNKHYRKRNRTIRRRKLRGGTCYGNGVGANSYNPNFTIYNTNLSTLFPYKP